MDIAGSIVVLLIAWWIAFQAMLSVGITSQTEAESQGHRSIGDPGAPIRPDLLRKGLWSAVIAIVIWAILFAIVHWSGLSFEDFPTP